MQPISAQLFDAAGRLMFPRPTHVFALRLDIETVVISLISSRGRFTGVMGRLGRTLPSLVGIKLLSLPPRHGSLWSVAHASSLVGQRLYGARARLVRVT
jgi:hypothetical protein